MIKKNNYGSEYVNVPANNISSWNEFSRGLIQFNSIQIFIIYVPSQQLQGQLQTQHSVDTGNYVMDRHNIKSKTNYMQALEEKTHECRKVNKQTNE
jgi:hypothetical protein